MTVAKSIPSNRVIYREPHRCETSKYRGIIIKN